MTTSESLPNRPNDPIRSPLEQVLARVLAANYELDQEIGRGGMGIVYRARDKRLKRLVAVKVLPPDLAYRSDIRSRFLREAETAAQLSHPNIVPIYTVEEADNLVFFIMAYVNGENLARELRLRGTISVDHVSRVLCEVADGLAYAHSRGVIHRDIKPDNILLDAESGRAMVTDFGIARALLNSTDTRLTTTGAAIGTPAYMSPEQCAGDEEIDGRSDLYSLGVVGYQLLSGDLPFVAPSTPAMLVKHLSETPRPLIDRVSIPQTLNDAIMRCLAKDPADRFATATDLVAALSGKPVPPPTRDPHQAPRTYGFGQTTVDAGGPSVNAAVVAHVAPTAPVPAAPASGYAPADVSRWEASPVRRFRRKLVGYLVFNGAFIPLGLMGHYESTVMTVTTIWGVVIASRYVKLWNRGYDWRDVLRRSRDTLFVDVVGETVDSTRAFFDPNKRQIVRERMRARLRQQSGLFALSPVETPVPGARPTTPPPRREQPMPVVTGVQAPVTLEGASQYPAAQRASTARAEIRRIYNTLPDSDRQLLPDVNASADALYVRIEMLAVRVDELERADVPGMGDAIEREITELERESNPFDEERSERRVRRLAQLKRQRISLRDLQERRRVAEQKLDRCVTAMQSMHLDLVRLTTGSRSHESITQLADQAIRLGGEVDAVLYANDEISRILR